MDNDDAMPALAQTSHHPRSNRSGAAHYDETQRSSFINGVAPFAALVLRAHRLHYYFNFVRYLSLKLAPGERFAVR